LEPAPLDAEPLEAEPLDARPLEREAGAREPVARDDDADREAPEDRGARVEGEVLDAMSPTVGAESNRNRRPRVRVGGLLRLM
jgi:hypothetical protein